MSTRTTRPEPEEHDSTRAARETEMQSDCDRTAAVLHRYVEGELDAIRALLVERHVAECPGCLAEKERLDLERLWLMETALDGPVLSTRLVEKVMEPVRREAAARSRLRLLRRLAMSAAAAFLVAGVLGYAYFPGTPGGAFDPGDPVSLTRAGSPASPPDESAAEGSPAAVRVSDDEGHLGPAERRLLDGAPHAAVRLAGLDATTLNPRADGGTTLSSSIAPIERGGFRVDRRSSRVVDFGLTNVSCLPTSQDDRSSFHEGSSCGIWTPVESTGRRRVFRVQLISRRAGGTTFRFEFRDTLGIALLLNGSGARPGEETHDGGHGVRARAVWTDLDPCTPDPNADGRTDSGDIAYGLQVLYGAQTPEVYDAEPPRVEPECEGSCLGA